MEGQTGLIVPDADLGAALRSITKPVKPTAKPTRKPRGPNKKRATPSANSDALAGLNT
jgi:hypothetical protein